MAEKRASFSKNINQMVVIGCGVAFFMIYVTCSVLLYMSEPETVHYYGKALFMFLIYIAIYLLVSWYMTHKIREMFLPLDQIADALVKDELHFDSDSDDLQGLADSLKEQMEKMTYISRELRATKSSLDVVYEENRQSKSQIISTLADCKVQCEKALHNQGNIISGMEQEKDILSRLESTGHGLKINKKTLYEDAQQLQNCIVDGVRSNRDTKEEIVHLKESFEVLSDMLTDSAGLIEEIYNEVTTIQTETTRTNLFAMNAALDAARSGPYNPSVVNALDDIKDMTGRINGKTDAVQLLAIRSRNSVKLALDQADFCVEKENESDHNFSVTEEKLGTLSQQILGILSITEAMMDGVTTVSGNLYELSKMYGGRTKENVQMQQRLEDVKEMLGEILEELETGRKGEQL